MRPQARFVAPLALRNEEYTRETWGQAKGKCWFQKRCGCAGRIGFVLRRGAPGTEARSSSHLLSARWLADSPQMHTPTALAWPREELLDLASCLGIVVGLLSVPKRHDPVVQGPHSVRGRSSRRETGVWRPGRWSRNCWDSLC